MKIEYRIGNLFLNSSALHICHCVNAQHKMKSGFAKELRERYPEAYDAYMAEKLKMGMIIPYQASDGRTIFHLVGQNHYGYDGGRYVSYDALVKGFEVLDTAAAKMEMTELHMPLIGAGLAGGSWSVISAIIERYCTNFKPIIYLLDGVVPNE